MIIMTMMLLLARICASAQDSARIAGEWQLEKIEVKLYAQADQRLLEEKVLTDEAGFNTLTGQAARSVAFSGTAYRMQFVYSGEQGTYTLIDPSQLRFSRMEAAAGTQEPPMEVIVTIGYALLPQDQLKLLMPAAYYKDSGRNMAVKCLYNCIYKKKTL